MRVGGGYLPIEVSYPLRGLNSSIPSTQVSSQYSPEIQNMFIREGVAFKRSGYNELVVKTMVGTVMALIDFELLNETRILVALTSRRQYRFHDGLDQWIDITAQGTAYPIETVSTGADWFLIDGNHTAELVAGALFEVAGSTGNDAEYTVISSSFATGKTTIFVAAVPSAVADGTLAKILELTTIEGDYIDWVVGTDAETHRLYFTNGRDRPRYWDGTSTNFTVWTPTYTDFVTCKTLEVFFDHLVLGNITTSLNEPKLVAWSNIAEFDEFEDGDAGAALIPAISGIIQTLETLGDRLTIWSNDTIAGAMFVGFPVVFSFEVIVPRGTRLISPRGVVSIGPAVLFASQENIYFFDGTTGLRNLGDEIRAIYKQAINHEFGKRLFTFNDVAKRIIYVVVPTSATGHIVFTLDYDIFDLNAFIWTKTQFADLPSCMGFFTRRDAPTWLSPPDVAWIDDYGIWADEGEKVNFPVRLMGTGGHVEIMDDISGLDDGDTVEALYETPDFVVPQGSISHTGRWGEIEVDLAGTEVSVYYSIDQGRTWTLVKVQTLTSTSIEYAFPMDVVSRTFRVRLISTKFFSLRWIRAWVHPGGPR